MDCSSPARIRLRWVWRRSWCTWCCQGFRWTVSNLFLTDKEKRNFQTFFSVHVLAVASKWRFRMVVSANRAGMCSIFSSRSTYCYYSTHHSTTTLLYSPTTPPWKQLYTPLLYYTPSGDTHGDTHTINLQTHLRTEESKNSKHRLSTTKIDFELFSFRRFWFQVLEY